MQGLAGKRDRQLGPGARTVDRIPDDRVSSLGQMNVDLAGPAGLEPVGHQAGNLTEALEDLKVSHGESTPGVDRRSVMCRLLVAGHSQLVGTIARESASDVFPSVTVDADVLEADRCVGEDEGPTPHIPEGGRNLSSSWGNPLRSLQDVRPGDVLQFENAVSVRQRLFALPHPASRFERGKTRHPNAAKSQSQKNTMSAPERSGQLLIAVDRAFRL